MFTAGHLEKENLYELNPKADILRKPLAFSFLVTIQLAQGRGRDKHTSRVERLKCLKWLFVSQVEILFLMSPVLEAQKEGFHPWHDFQFSQSGLFASEHRANWRCRVWGLRSRMH